MSDIAHVYSQFYGLYHTDDLDYAVDDEEPEPTDAEIDNDEEEEELPPSPLYRKATCIKCKGPNLSLRSRKCIACRCGFPSA